MKVIHHYPVGKVVEIPAGATFAAYHDSRVWFEVDPDAPLEERAFNVVPTGRAYRGTYLATSFHSYPLVWHVVEVRP